MENEERLKNLTQEQYEVTQNKATEPPFTGVYWNCKDGGVYHCICCDSPLFSSSTKYESGTGWPSFWEPVNASAIEEESDFSHGINRVEALCSSCGAHLGHIFPDGPTPTGMRYCLNSASLDLKKTD
jgi:peptide-methionine (R)-S-oxide reductase